MTELWVLVGFHLFVVAMLALDLGVFQRRAHVVSLREAAAWSVLWIVLALLFALGIWRLWDVWDFGRPGAGADKAVEFLTGYLVEKALSVDNLFVFLVIFRYFGVPATLQPRILAWGILGALVLRASLIVLGAALLGLFHWMLYVFAVFLIYTGLRLARPVDEEIDPGRNWLVRLVRRFVPLVDSYESGRFWVRQAGRWHATPLPLVLLVVESTDILFALDSIPAIFGITRDPFIVYTSNVFAILGLRALYFLLVGVLGMFRYLHVGLALVLVFVGLKMLAEELFASWLGAHGIEQRHMILFSLAVIAGVLGAAVLASVLAGPKEPPTPATGNGRQASGIQGFSPDA
jgi:tellurite resistance protein TerC